MKRRAASPADCSACINEPPFRDRRVAKGPAAKRSDHERDEVGRTVSSTS